MMDRDDIRAVLELVAPLRRKLALVASRCVAAIVRDTTQTQNAQVENLEGEAFDQVEHMQSGGLTHVPLAGAEGVRITMAGVYDDSVVLALSNRANRPTGLAAGETALYNASATQSTVTIRANGDVEVTLAAGATLKVVGDDGPDFAALASKVDEALAKLETHVHLAPSGGGNTGGPLALPSTPIVFDPVAATTLEFTAP